LRAAAGRATQLSVRSQLLKKIKVLLFLTYLRVEVWKIKEQWHPTAGGLATWAYSVVEYLAVIVIPYTAPILIAISVHQQLRSRMFSK
jgi:hypothetical protein